MFANTEYYKQSYLMGRTPVIPIEQSEYWLREATDIINFKNIPESELEDKFTKIPDATMDKLKRATCRVAEILYAEEQAVGMPGEGVKRSESVGDYSVSYESQKRTEGEMQRGIKNVIKKHLANTELHNSFVWQG